MFYIYISCDDGTPLFMNSVVVGQSDMLVNCMDGTVMYHAVKPVYEDVWHESPIHAMMFNDDGDAIRYVCEHHPTMRNIVSVMGEYEARQYL